MSAACPVCQGSGETMADGYLDCAQCDAAVERAAFDKLYEQQQAMTLRDIRWWAFQVGKAAALEQAAKLPPVPTAKERSDADMAQGFYKQSFVYFAEEARELRARLNAITNTTEK